MNNAEKLSKLVESIVEEKTPMDAIKQLLMGKATVKDLGDGELAIATGDMYSVHVKVMGWYQPKPQ